MMNVLWRAGRHAGKCVQRVSFSSAAEKRAEAGLRTTPSPFKKAGADAPAAGTAAASGPAHSVLRIWAEGTIGRHSCLWSVWGLEEQQCTPSKFQ